MKQLPALNKAGALRLPFASRRDKDTDRLKVIGVVQDQQPAFLDIEPAQDSFDDQALLVFVTLRQIEEGRDKQIVGTEKFSRVSSNPKHSLIVLAVTIGIFDSGLRFADASQAANSLGLSDGNGLLPVKKGCTKLDEDILTPGEEEVAGIRHIPDQGRRP